MALGEFELIERFFSAAGTSPFVSLGVGDDAAILSLPDGHSLHVSTDTMVAGAHYSPDMSAEDIAYRAVMAAASDLAAMGAAPLGMLLSLTLPEADGAWIARFAEGLRAAATDTGLALVGGDTTRGPATIGITVMGSAPTGSPLLRSGARVGDRVCVSGFTGDAAAGLAILEGKIHLSAAAENYLVKRFTRPAARLALGQSLRGLASAAIDISDGLMADAGHLARASGVAIVIDRSALPQSAALREVIDERQRAVWMLAGGDDYELLFTLPANAVLPEGCTEVGRVTEGSGVSCDGIETPGGYDHFA